MFIYPTILPVKMLWIVLEEIKLDSYLKQRLIFNIS